MAIVGEPHSQRPTTSGLWDAAGATLLTALLVLASRHLPTGPQDRALDGLGYLLVVVTAGSLGFARRHPRWVAGLVTSALVTYALREYPGGSVYATGWLALFVLSWQSDRRTALVAAAMMSGLLVLTDVVTGSGSALWLLAFVGWSAVAVFLGETLRNRHRRMDELRERARFLERTREQETRRRIAEDRLRIARDLHDSVAHAMTTINVQAGSALHVADRRPQAPREALAIIQQASSEVLDELMAMLSLLRQEDEPPAERVPTPGLENVKDVVEATRQVGIPVALTINGPVTTVPRQVGLAAYRIIQESLTNVMRHAGHATVTVKVHVHAGRALTIEIVDDGSGAPVGHRDGAGVGIRGMRERAEATGGRLKAGPGATGGFTVRARWAGVS